MLGEGLGVRASAEGSFSRHCQPGRQRRSAIAAIIAQTNRSNAIGIWEVEMDQPRKRPLKVGIFLPLIANQGVTGAASWRDLLAMTQRAENLGFDSVWVPDHLIFRHPGEETTGVWEAMSMLTALAAATSRIELGPLVLCAGFRNPALLAKMADTIDEISGGRFILGLGAGWHKPEYDAFGYPFDHRYARFEEALTIIHGLLHDGHIDFDGTYYQARDCELLPRGPRPSGPPILIGTSGHKMLRLTARYADSWNVDWRNSPDDIPPYLADLDEACVEVGRDPKTMGRTVGVEVDMPGNSGRGLKGKRTPPLSGQPEEMAAVLRAYAALGVDHIQILLDPNTIEAVEGFAPVLESLDRS